MSASECSAAASFGALRHDGVAAVSTASGVEIFDKAKRIGAAAIPGARSLAWNPRGNFLAVALDREIRFIEKGGQPRLVLPFDEGSDVVKVEWSCDNEFLAVAAADGVFLLEFKNRVFTRKLRLPGRDFAWLPDRLAIVTDSVEWSLVASIDADENAVYVINGKTVQVSEWGRSLIPPPLFHRKLEFESQVQAVLPVATGPEPPVREAPSDRIRDAGVEAWIEGVRLHVKCAGREADREVEPGAVLLFFSRKLNSLVLEMERGNLETVAPHVVAVAEVERLLGAGSYRDALEYGRRYRVPFSEMLTLARVDLAIVFEQLPDALLKAEIAGVSDKIWLEEFAARAPRDRFVCSICVALAVLGRQPEAVAFASARNALGFIQTFIDESEMFDFGLRTFDRAVIAAVARFVGREAELVDLLEEEDPLLWRARLCEEVGDFSGQVSFLAQAGDLRSAAFVAKRGGVLDAGLAALPVGCPEWVDLLELKAKSGSSGLTDALVRADPDVARKFLREALKVEPASWRRLVEHVGFDAVSSALAEAGAYAEAGRLELERGNRQLAGEHFITARRWRLAAEAGADIAPAIADGLVRKLRTTCETARKVRGRALATKDPRTLGGLQRTMAGFIPTAETVAEVAEAALALGGAGAELEALLGEVARACWPIPGREGQQAPEHLRRWLS